MCLLPYIDVGTPSALHRVQIETYLQKEVDPHKTFVIPPKVLPVYHLPRLKVVPAIIQYMYPDFHKWGYNNLINLQHPSY